MNRDSVVQYLTSAKMLSYIALGRAIFKDLPHIPQNVKESLMKIIPWLTIIGAVLMAVAGIEHLMFAMGVRAIRILFGSSTYWVLTGVLELVAAYIAFLAFPLLKEKKYNGWVLLFWNCVLGLVMSVVTLAFVLGNLVGAVLAAAISFYLVYEFEPLYKSSMKSVMVSTDTKPKTNKK